MINPFNISLFVVLSALAVAATVHSWRHREHYGYYRFVAFECLILLIAYNTNRWFAHPLSLPQILSWIVLIGSTVLVIPSFLLLRRLGGARMRVVEETQRVVETGVYRYIRHPMYASLILFGWGVFLKGVDVLSGALAGAATLLLFATARSEERFNAERLGIAYSDYMRRTKMFVPHLI